MTEPITWVFRDLQERYPQMLKGRYIDLNNNGRPDANEILATYNNNNIPGNDPAVVGDWADGIAFLRANMPRLKNMGGIFAAAGRFKTTNPFHIITAIESPRSSTKELIDTYDLLWKVLDAVKSRITADMTPKEKITALFNAMQSLGLMMKERYSLVTWDMHRRPLDYGSVTAILLAVGHEMGWPLYPVRLPKNIFVRWEGNGVRFNIDQGAFPTDQEYMKKYRLTPAILKQTGYLKSIRSDRETIAITLRMMAEPYFFDGNHTMALKYLNAALKLDPTFVRAWNIRAVVKRLLKDYDGSLADAQKAVALHPKYGDAYHNMGLIYQLKGNHTKAVECFDKAILYKRTDAAMDQAAKENLANSLRERGTSYMHLRKFAQAIGDLTTSCKLAPKIAASYISLGLTHFRMTNYAKAAAAFEQANELAPNDVTVHYSLGRTYYAMGQFRKAGLAYAASLNVKPTNSVTHYNMGLVQYKLGQYADAEKSLSHAIEYADKRYAKASYYRAFVREALGDHAMTKRNVDNAIIYYLSAMTDFEDAHMLDATISTQKDIHRHEIPRIKTKCCKLLYERAIARVAAGQAAVDRYDPRKARAAFESAKKDFDEAAALDPASPAKGKLLLLDLIIKQTKSRFGRHY